MIVHQECFKTLKDFNNKSKFRKGTNNPGVYLWGFSLENTDFTIPSTSKKFLPFYVGKVAGPNGCMYKRTQEHLCSLMGGNISIFEITSILASNMAIPDFGTIRSDYEKKSNAAKKVDNVGPNLPDPNYPHLLHYPEGVHRMFHFNSSSEIKAEVDWMLKHFCITYFKPAHYNKEDIIDLEKYIGNIVEYKRLITKRYESPSNFNLEIVHEPKNIVVNEYEHLFEHCKGKMVGVEFGI